MRSPKSQEQLRQEWQSVRRIWLDVYQWPSLSNPIYSEQIAALILKDYDQIELNVEGLRESGFRLLDHKGQCKLQTSIEQFTEKRFLRALWNRKEVAPLGKILDYEIPLRGRRGARHGTLDLLGLNDSGLLIIEAKANADDSLLKAMLQAFTYTCLVQHVKVRFLVEYDQPSRTLVPTVLAFGTVRAGEQLVTLNQYPNVQELLTKLNGSLTQLEEGQIAFFLCENGKEDLNRCLTIEPFSSTARRIIFKEDFQPRFRRMLAPDSSVES